jgi:hypothetical protein
MTDSFPLTAAALRKHASDFHDYEQQLAWSLAVSPRLLFAMGDFFRLHHADWTLATRISSHPNALTES